MLAMCHRTIQGKWFLIIPYSIKCWMRKFALNGNV